MHFRPFSSSSTGLPRRDPRKASRAWEFRARPVQDRSGSALLCLLRLPDPRNTRKASAGRGKPSRRDAVSEEEEGGAPGTLEGEGTERRAASGQGGLSASPGDPPRDRLPDSGAARTGPDRVSLRPGLGSGVGLPDLEQFLSNSPWTSAPGSPF